MMNVSALNNCEIFFFDAPSARRIPISFVLSITEIYVMIPIIIDETIRDTATNAISTYEIPLMIVVKDDVIKAT